MTKEIINQIKRNLSGNPDLDRDYLVSQLDYYKNHESAYEIIKEISGLIWQSLDFYHEENNEESRRQMYQGFLMKSFHLLKIVIRKPLWKN